MNYLILKMQVNVSDAYDIDVSDVHAMTLMLLMLIK